MLRQLQFLLKLLLFEPLIRFRDHDQLTLADFLDRETARIDALIEKNKRAR